MIKAVRENLDGPIFRPTSVFNQRKEVDMFECYADLEEILEDRLNDQTELIDSAEEQQDQGVVVGSDKKPALIEKEGATGCGQVSVSPSRMWT